MYKMFIITESGEIPIPVLPETLEIDSPGLNESFTVLELGEINRLKKKGLRTVSWESFFPKENAPYVTGSMIDPAQAVRMIQTARDSKKPMRFLILGSDLDINIRVGVESFNYRETYGQTGDIYYTISLKEWKDYGPKRIEIEESEEGTEAPQEAVKKEPPRAGEPPKTNAYTVQPGDSLWAIAKRHYGDGSKWPKIYDANRSVVGSNPDLIHPNQNLVIP